MCSWIYDDITAYHCSSEIIGPICSGYMYLLGQRYLWLQLVSDRWLVKRKYVEDSMSHIILATVKKDPSLSIKRKSFVTSFIISPLLQGLLHNECRVVSSVKKINLHSNKFHFVNYVFALMSIVFNWRAWVYFSFFKLRFFPCWKFCFKFYLKQMDPYKLKVGHQALFTQVQISSEKSS